MKTPHAPFRDVRADEVAEYNDFPSHNPDFVPVRVSFDLGHAGADIHLSNEGILSVTLPTRQSDKVVSAYQALGEALADEGFTPAEADALIDEFAGKVLTRSAMKWLEGRMKV